MRYEQAFPLLQDSITGILSIESVLESLEEKEKFKTAEALLIKKDLNNYISEIVGVYENKQYVELEKKIEELINKFCIWKDFVSSIINLYIVS